MEHIIKCDILILGAGLSGLKTAISALERNPDLNVLTVSFATKPTGSSFTNSNNALGIQVLETDAEKQQFIDQATKIAAPGHFDHFLVELMAEKSLDRYRDMLAMGIEFDREQNKKTKRFNACFNSNTRCARIFRNLAHAYKAFSTKAASLGMNRLAADILDLSLDHNGHAQGAMLKVNRGLIQVTAKAIVIAMGGPSKLYKWNMAAHGASGLGMGIMAKAGVNLANAGFVQFMWNRIDTCRFVSPGRLALSNAILSCPGLADINFADLSGLDKDNLKSLADSRLTHCPVAYGFMDNILDKILLKNLASDGTINIRTDSEFSIAPMAHAGNGGAVVDAKGRTSVPGLWAVGECATGMHGANRIGGGSILSTQVFGYLAGISAAKHCQDTPEPKFNFKTWQGGMETTPEFEKYIQDNMQKYAVAGCSPGFRKFHIELANKENKLTGLDKILAKSALSIASDLATSCNT